MFRHASRIFIGGRDFVVSFFTRSRLFFRAFRLIGQIIRFKMYVARFLTIRRRLRALNRVQVTTICLYRQERFFQVINSRDQLSMDAFTRFSRSFVSRFTFTRYIIGLRVRFLTGFSCLFFIRTYRVVTNIFLSEIRRNSAFMQNFRIGSIITCFCLDNTICVRASFFGRFFYGFRRPIVILMNGVCFRTNGFEVIHTIRSFIARILACFVRSFRAACG